MGFYLQISSRLALSFMMVTWILLVLGALGSNHGTPLVYVLFSALYLMLLISAFYRQRTYGYTFLVVMLWLGFWLKSTWHRILGSGFPEPIGQFAGTSEQWDRCFFVAMAAALGIVGARMAIHFLAGGHQTLRSQQGGPPSWLKGNGPWHWGIFALVVSVTSVANFHYEIFVVGLKTGTILPWPLNALITLMVAGGGFALWMATLLWYEIRSSGRAFYGAIFLILAALIITSSSLSRGMIVMLLIPIFYSLYLNFNSLEDLSRRSRRVFLFLVLLAVIIINFFVITHLRDGIYYQSKSPIEQSVEERQFPSAIKPLYSILKKGGGLLTLLSTDGLELKV